MENGGALERWTEWMRSLARYHQSVVVGAEHVPLSGGLIVLGTHSLASYELFIICCFSREVIGRRTLIVGDDLMFRIPGLKKPLTDIGFIPGNREDTMARLRDGEMVGIAPGGMRESLRPSSGRYSYDWSRRKGFAAVAMKAGVPVVPTVCPLADDIFTVHDNPVTPFIYERFKIPLPLFHGRWFMPVPRPVKLVHWIGPPIVPDVAPDQVTDEAVARYHQKITTAIDALVAEAVRVGHDIEGRGARPLGWA